MKKINYTNQRTSCSITMKRKPVQVIESMTNATRMIVELYMYIDIIKSTFIG
jgi:hypothetical protein